MSRVKTHAYVHCIRSMPVVTESKLWKQKKIYKMFTKISEAAKTPGRHTLKEGASGSLEKRGMHQKWKLEFLHVCNSFSA